jgi:hypothetical protein
LQPPAADKLLKKRKKRQTLMSFHSRPDVPATSQATGRIEKGMLRAKTPKRLITMELASENKAAYQAADNDGKNLWKCYWTRVQ